MEIHYIQHVPFETPANILKWAKEKGYSISGTHLYENPSFPDISSFDMLVVMGGPMGVYDENLYPWLVDEKRFIENVIKSGKKILGVCLGAQLIADVLGAKVYKNKYKEIGWFPVRLTEDGKKSLAFKGFPEEFTAFHWHGDTFDIPHGAKHLAFSEGCKNQAFEYDNRVFAIQFHLETDELSAKLLMQSSVQDLKDKGIYVQEPDYILSLQQNFLELKNLLYRFLNNITDES